LRKILPGLKHAPRIEQFASFHNTSLKVLLSGINQFAVLAPRRLMQTASDTKRKAKLLGRKFAVKRREKPDRTPKSLNARCG